MEDKNNNNQTYNNSPEEMQQETLENNSTKPQQNHSIPETAARIGGGIAGRRIAENINAKKHSDMPNSNTANDLNEQPNTSTPSQVPQQTPQPTPQNIASNQPPIAPNEGANKTKTSPQQTKNPDAPQNSDTVPKQAKNSIEPKENPVSPKANKTRNNNGKTSNLNPSRRFNPKNIASKHSKHSGSNDIPPLSENETGNNPVDKIKNKVTSKKNIQKSAVQNGAKKMTNAASKVASTAARSASKLVAGIASFIMSSPVVIITGLVICLAVLFASLIAPFIAGLQPYGEDDDGNVCFATAPCTNIILKVGEEEKKYKLDEYIAGAMVNYYNGTSISNDVSGVKTYNDNLLKALAIIIHTDISIYSSYNSATSTCTINDSSKFKTVYTPTVIENDSDITDDSGNNEENSSDNSTNSNNQDNNQDDGTDLETDNDKYYYQAKKAAKAVISEVTNIYSKNLELKYSDYIQVLQNAVALGDDYKKILHSYIENDPGYTPINATDDSDDNNQNDTNDDESIMILPICYFEESSNSDISVVHSDNVCSTVHINNGSNSGDYTIDTFIEGVVYNEARAWSNSLDTLKAHAVAARTYLVNRARVENGTCYIDVGTNTMGFTNNTNDAIHKAVTETSGEYIMVNGSISKEAEWDALCIKDLNTTSSNYTICQKSQQIPKSWFDEVTLFNSKEWYNEHSHGRGMSQYGAYYLATKQSKSYREIISYYYDADISILSSKEYIMPLNSFTYISGEVYNRCDGKASTHKGLDLAAPKGTPVYAAHAGTVIKFYDTNFQCANSCKSGQYEGLGVKIDNGDGTYSAYMHFSSRENLTIGQKIEAGQKLGEVGNTGSARGASGGYHLHYQMGRISDGVVLNPRDYLPLDEKGFGVCYKP